MGPNPDVPLHHCALHCAIQRGERAKQNEKPLLNPEHDFRITGMAGTRTHWRRIESAPAHRLTFDSFHRISIPV